MIDNLAYAPFSEEYDQEVIKACRKDSVIGTRFKGYHENSSERTVYFGEVFPGGAQFTGSGYEGYNWKHKTEARFTCVVALDEFAEFQKSITTLLRNVTSKTNVAVSFNLFELTSEIEDYVESEVEDSLDEEDILIDEGKKVAEAIENFTEPFTFDFLVSVWYDEADEVKMLLKTLSEMAVDYPCIQSFGER